MFIPAQLLCRQGSDYRLKEKCCFSGDGAITRIKQLTPNISTLER